MKKKIAIFKTGTLPQAYPLKQSIATSIGRTIARHAYLDSILASVLYTLLSISPKQGRAAIRLPPARRYAQTVQQLFRYLKIQTIYDFNSLASKLDAADRARNVLAHSIYLYDKDSGKVRIQIVTGSWELGPDVEREPRAITPETPIVDRSFLSKQRASIEAAIKRAHKLQLVTGYALATLSKKRRTQAAWDRRHHPQTGSSAPTPP
jgi:hypothetical protein